MNFTRKHYFPILCTLLILHATSCRQNEAGSAASEDWISLFNGKDLTGWDVKIAGYDLNDNYRNTFQVQDSAIQVRYDEYDSFTTEFGHLYYQTPYAYYRLRMEYRFKGEQLSGGPDYARLNSGVMVHSQSAASCDKDQFFPVSLEMQFLASDSSVQRPTGNLCTPGTAFVMNGEPNYAHCIDSESPPYDKEQWVSVEVVVLGDSLIHHVVEGDTVLTYESPFITDYFVGETMTWTNAGFTDSVQWTSKKDVRLGKGYIALQAESHPLEFRHIELLDLEGCKDKRAKNYKPYFIQADVSRCKY